MCELYIIVDKSLFDVRGSSMVTSLLVLYISGSIIVDGDFLWRFWERLAIEGSATISKVLKYVQGVLDCMWFLCFIR